MTLHALTYFFATFHVFPRIKEVAFRNLTSPNTQEHQQQIEEYCFLNLQTLHQCPIMSKEYVKIMKTLTINPNITRPAPTINKR